MNTILIVEDEAQVRDLLIETLGLEYRLTLAATSGEALARMALTIPDLILLDLTLEHSEMNGMELCAHLKNSPEFQHIPILVLSGTDTPSVIGTARLLGANGYIVKPYRPMQLLNAIETLLRGSE